MPAGLAPEFRPGADATARPYADIGELPMDDESAVVAKRGIPTMAPDKAPVPTKDEILARVENDGIQFINLQFTDVMGIVKSVTIPAGIFEHVIDGGQWIDGSSIAGFTRIAESDMFLVPDLVHLRGAAVGA